MTDLTQRTADTLYLACGDRVQTHPGTDAWMSGDRFGTVVRVYLSRDRSRVRVVVLLDRSGHQTTFSPDQLTRA